MKRETFILFILYFFLSSCNSRNVSEELPSHNFCGYGLIEFSKSYSGSIRYMVFYPIYKADFPDLNFANNLKITIKNGIIIRGKNSTKLWQALIEKNNLNPDEYGYYKSLIFLDLSNNTLEYNYDRPIPNEVIFIDNYFKTKTFDNIKHKGKLDILDYEIFYSLEPAPAGWTVQK